MTSGGRNVDPGGGGGVLTDEDLQDLHEDILDRNERGVRSILRDFSEQELPTKELCCTEVELEPASNDHELNKLPLTAAHRAALIDSHVILDAILTSCPEFDINSRLKCNGYTPLHMASSAGVLASVNYLASMRAKVEARDAEGSTPLHLAAKNGRNDVISVLCVRGGSVNTYNEEKQTALHLAAEAGNMETVDILLGKSADVNFKDIFGRTPLHSAQVKGHVDVTRKLIGRGARINEQDDDGNTPLHVWVANLDKKLKEHSAPTSNSSFAILLDKGSDVNAQNHDGDTALHLATRLGAEEVISVLLDHDIKVNIKNKQGRSAIFYTITEVACEMFLENDASCTVTDTAGNGILQIYAGSNDVTTSMMDDVIEDGADVNTANKLGMTPLHCACAAGNLDKVKLLLNAGAWNDVIDTRGRSILHISLLHNHQELSQWLLKQNNISLTHQDKEGNSVLHLSAQIGCKAVVDYLLSRQVDINKKNHEGKSPATLAADCRQLRTLRSLLRQGGALDSISGAHVLLDYVAMNDRKVAETLLKQVSCNEARDDQGRSALHIAMENSFSDMAKLLLDKNADVEAVDHLGALPLHVACHKLPEMESILPRLMSRENCTRQDANGMSALHYGIGKCSVDTLRLFLKHGFDVNVRNFEGQSVAHMLLQQDESSSKRDLQAKLRTIVQSKVFNPNATDNSGMSLLLLAVASEDAEIVGLILEKKPDIDSYNKQRETPLHCACSLAKPEVVSMLLESSADINAKDCKGQTPLFHAVDGGSSEVVSMLLAKGASLDEQDARGKTCLMMAMDNGKSHLCMDILTEVLPDVQLRDESGRSLIHCASAKCAPNVVKLLLREGCDVTSTDHVGNTTLHHAALNTDQTVMELLLHEGADINIQNADGDTTLHICTKRGSYDHVDLLLGNSADVDLCNKHKQTATHLAAMATDSDVIQLIVANEADVDVIDSQGNTPLMVGISHGNPEACTVLMEQDADVTTINVDGDSVLHLAFRQNKLDLKFLKLLVFRACDLLTLCNGEGLTPVEILKKREDVDVVHFAQELNFDL